MIHNSEFFDNIGQVLRKYPDIDLSDLFSKGQMNSKRWLVDKLIDLDVDLGTVFLCAGWYGSLATFLFESGLPLNKIRSFDIDPSCADIADTFNRSWTTDGWKFKATTLDIVTMEYPTWYETTRADGSTAKIKDTPDTIVNTSCEHIADFDRWYKAILPGTLLVLQSNNYFELDEHVNCVNDIYEFKQMAPMSELHYMGMREMPKYTRFMLIGYK